MIAFHSTFSPLLADQYSRALPDATPCASFHPDANYAFICGISYENKPLVDQYRQAGIPIIGFWIGSDALHYLQNRWNRQFYPKFDLHLATSKRICKELEIADIKAEPLYPCLWSDQETTPVTVPRIAVYQPGIPNATDLYLLKVSLDIMRSAPDVDFLMYGGDSYGSLPQNCMALSRFPASDTQLLFKNCSALLRLTQHDGYPVTAIEAKCRGRHVICNYPYPGFQLAETKAEVLDLIRDPAIHELDQSDFPAWYRENFSQKAFREALYAYLARF